MIHDASDTQQLPRHRSFFGDGSRPRYFAPLPEKLHGAFVAVSPISGRLHSLDRLWSLLTMDPEFESASIVFTGTYLSGPHAPQLLSLLCTLRLAHPSPIFLAGPTDLAAAAYLGLLKNLELSVALNAVGASWAEENHEVFAAYGVSSMTATDLLHAMPPEHREFLTELAVSVKHTDLVLTAMPATTLAASSLTSEFASDFFTLPHPIQDPTSLAPILHSDHSPPPPSSPSMACGSRAADGADVYAVNRRNGVSSRMEVVHDDRKNKTDGHPAPEKTMYVDPLSEFPGINIDGVAMNGSGLLAALFFPSGRIIISPDSGEK